MTWRARIGAGAIGLALACVLPLSVDAGSARAGALYLHSCSKLGDGGNGTDVAGAVWTGVGNGSYSEANRCAQGGSFQIDTTGGPMYSDNGQWHTITPASIGIVAAYTPPNAVLIDPQIGADGYSASFFWGASQAITPTGNCCGGMDYAGGINRADLGGSHYFGFQVTCLAVVGGCGTPATNQLLDVSGIELQGIDNTPPTTSAPGATNLWYEANRWVRGAWPAAFQAGDDSGICGTAVAVDGQTIAGSSDSRPNQGSWTQCPTPVTISKSLDTANYPDGPLSLAFSAWDAANPVNVSSPAETVYVDNQPVSLSLSGPTDAPSTAGTQYITATAAAGPSGAGIACSLDGAPSDFLPGPSAQIAVQGLGAHQVSCYAQNGAIDAGGQPARSPVQTWSLSIRQPSVSALSFDRVVGRLRCARARERVTVPAQWVIVHSHGRRLRVKLPAQTRRISVVRCHPRFVVRTVVMNGHRLTERIVVLPRRLRATTKRLPFGARTSVAGWLGTNDGNALGDQRVQILAAPDNGENKFTPAASATTAADGSWSAPLPAGPSRIVKAVYAGSSAVEPSESLSAHVIVPALISVRARPSSTHWGGTITISGRLHGGYVPPAGEVVVLWIGWRGGSTEIGHLYAGREGRFASTYTFLRGNGTETYRLWAATARESDYPYTASRSRRVTVVVGP